MCGGESSPFIDRAIEAVCLVYYTHWSTMQRFVRLLSTKAANHTPPIKIYGVAGKYAEATYIAASKVSFQNASHP